MQTKVLSELYKRKYVIGFLTLSSLSLSEKERYSKIKWLNLKGYGKGWFADPFILNQDDDLMTILAEEFVYSEGKGRISKLVVNKNDWSIRSITPVLSLDTHLSFPIFKEYQGKIYVYPENYQSGSLKIYEYDTLSDKLINPITIIDKPLLDTQIFSLNDKYYACGVAYSQATMDDTKKLFIYEANDFFGPYKLYQVIENEHCEERGAGQIFCDGNTLIRPCQNCEGAYGRSIIFKAIDIDESGNFVENEISRLEPDSSKRYGSVLHTFNMSGNIAVIDGKGYIHYSILNIISPLISILRTIKKQFKV